MGAAATAAARFRFTVGSRWRDEDAVTAGPNPAEMEEVAMSLVRTLTNSMRWIAALLLAFGAVAFAANAVLVVDPAVFDYDADTCECPNKAGVTLAFDGTTLQVHLVKDAVAPLPMVNVDFYGETPKGVFDRVDVSAALQRVSLVDTMVGGVMMQHRETNLGGLRGAYVEVMGNLGFTMEATSSTTCWHFSNGVTQLRVNAVPAGKHVNVYVGR